MIRLLVESISIQLEAAFGEDYTIYDESIEQGLKEPCFFIQCLNPTEELFFWKRYFRKNQFCIQYFPENKLHGKEECYAVGERLFSCLEYLDVGGDLVMGTKRKYEVVDGILHFFVNYDLFVYKVAEPVPFMEEVSSETHVKG